ncbi:MULTISPECIES: DUF7146 domain-containing protein [Sphingomonadaceae]|uniref:DUF7146 domain-containing protein n=1 Tax=Sphingomonadales TaxID=204457 RepID=UPI00076FEE2F|nr:toprim domain-containing protein [Sphingobium sp. TKS]AMK23192.1 hypothetical protein K426_11270 [Sphingobium sp. TKS]MCF8707572.1 toprim domain-containing protein [Rhizorhapis sp. SPR117]
MSQSLLTNRNLELEALGSGLVKRLGGVWSSDRGMCLCPAHDDRSPSLSVRIGDSALLFKCFAGCDTRDVLRAIRRLDRNALQSLPSEDRAPTNQDSSFWLRQRALDLWDASIPLAGTPAEEYLRRRSLPAVSRALRYNRYTPLGRGKIATLRPALISALHERGNFVAVQRTFLDPSEPRRARDLANPRRMLGRPLGGAVTLAPAGDTLGLAEGMETAYSAMILFDLPVWATLGNERLAGITIPETVTRLLLLPDNDRGGRIGATKAEQAYGMPGRTIETIWPPPRFNDWNDVLRKYGKGGPQELRRAA